MSKKSVLLSIKPKFCELIASGKKTVEIRKNCPKIDTPFKVYIYQTKGRWIYKILEWLGLYQQKVIGEFVCDDICVWEDLIYGKYYASIDELNATCLTSKELWIYQKAGQKLYAWHISNLVIYDKPKELSEFHKRCNDIYGCGAMPPLTRPPQSWCYVEESEVKNDL